MFASTPTTTRATGELGPAAMRAVRAAADWNERSGTAIAVELAAPTDRVIGALSRAVLLSDQEKPDTCPAG